MRVIPAKTSQSIRKARKNIHIKLRNSRQKINQMRKKVREKKQNLNKIKQGFIQRFVQRRTKQLRTDDSRMKKQIAGMQNWKKRKLLNALKGMNRQISRKRS